MLVFVVGAEPLRALDYLALVIQPALDQGGDRSRLCSGVKGGFLGDCFAAPFSAHLGVTNALLAYTFLYLRFASFLH